MNGSIRIVRSEASLKGLFPHGTRLFSPPFRCLPKSFSGLLRALLPNLPSGSVWSFRTEVRKQVLPSIEREIRREFASWIFVVLIFRIFVASRCRRGGGILNEYGPLWKTAHAANTGDNSRLSSDGLRGVRIGCRGHADIERRSL